MAAVKLYRPRREAFTMIELVIVLGIIVILAGIGVSSTSDLLPRFRARKAANQMAADISRARMTAMMHGREAKFEVTDWDSSPTKVDSPAYGSWEISLGNKTTASTCFDVLPWETGCLNLDDSEGVRDISKDGEDHARFVGLEEPDVFEITFDSRGWVDNNSSDLAYGDEAGMIEYFFYNKHAAAKGLDDYYIVRVYRSGMIRVENGLNESQYENDAGGTNKRTSLPD